MLQSVLRTIPLNDEFDMRYMPRGDSLNVTCTPCQLHTTNARMQY